MRETENHKFSKKTEENDFYLTGYLSKLHEKGRQMYNGGYINEIKVKLRNKTVGKEL